MNSKKAKRLRKFIKRDEQERKFQSVSLSHPQEIAKGVHRFYRDVKSGRQEFDWELIKPSKEEQS